MKYAALTLLMFVPFLVAQEPTPPAPPAPPSVIRFPDVVPPIPPPTPPGSVPVLPGNTLYVITSTQPFFVRVTPTSLATYQMETGPIVINARFIENPNKQVTRKFMAPHVCVVQAVGSGRAEIICIPSGVTKDSDIVSRLVDCLAAPLPPPDPPNPPLPIPAPIPADGLHVLIVEDALNRSKLPASQLEILFSAEVRNYLNATCPAGADGKTKEWRIWPTGIDASADSKLWQDAFKRAIGTANFKAPWVIVSNPKKGGGWEGPLPLTTTDMMTLLRKYGG